MALHSKIGVIEALNAVRQLHHDDQLVVMLAFAFLQHPHSTPQWKRKFLNKFDAQAPEVLDDIAAALEYPDRHSLRAALTP